MSFQAEMLDAADDLFHLGTPGAREQRDGGAFDGGITGLHDPRIRQVWDEADAARGVRLEMAAESAGEVEDVDVLHVDAVRFADDPQAGNVRALGLREFARVVLGETDAGRELDLFESAELVHAAGAEELAENIDQAGAADSGRCGAADHPQVKRAILVDPEIFDGAL